MGYIYTWIPAYREIVSTLRQHRNNQAYLIQVLRDIGINVPDDEDSPGHKIPLTAIDPFSFLFYLGVPRNNWNKIKAIRAICELWNINVNVYDVSGIPTANAQRLRMFSWQYMRNNEIDRLWNIFEQLLQNSLTDNDFQEVIGFAGVGKTKLTEAFFIVRPDAYLCINAKVKPYLETLGLNTHFETFSAYQNLLQRIRQVTDQPFPQISFHAHLLAEYGEHKPAFFRVGTTVGENGASMLPIMIQQNIISIGWHKIGNLLEIEPCNRIHVKEALQRAGYYENDNSVASRKAGEILQFKDNIFPGDYVLAAEGQSIKAIGKVVSDHYIFDDQLTFPNLKCVEWLNPNVSDLQIAEGTRTSVWKYEQPESIEKIQKYLGEMQSVEAHISEDDKQKSNNSMELNRILYGPPGTGKTFHSITHAVSIIDKLDLDELKQQCESSIGRKAIKDRFDALVQSGNIVFTTFHQSLSYEDFIEGIKPLEPTPGQSMQYDVVDGVFKKLCDEAKTSEYSESNQSARPFNFVLIIDEINRGNVSQIFGELITLIEPDKRIGGAEEILVTLPYSKEAFGVPSNLYIIGTMNTADRSVEALDTALRRRFSFVPMMPMPEQLSSNCENIDLKALLETINKRLTVLKDKDHTIGHAWLWNIHTLNDLRAVFKDKVMPLLQEYFYNDYEKLGLVLGSRFVEEEHTGDQNIFANFPLGNAMRNQYSHKRVLTITDPSTWDAEAFQRIYIP